MFLAINTSEYVKDYFSQMSPDYAIPDECSHFHNYDQGDGIFRTCHTI